MTQETFAIVSIIPGLVSVALLVFLLFRLGGSKAGKARELEAIEKGQDRIERTLRDEMAQIRKEALEGAKLARDEQRESMKTFGGTLDLRMEATRKAVEERLKNIQEDNTAKLEKIRGAVEEKLQETLEKRVSESFKLVSGQLEQVSKGLGEMRELATNVGDLSRIMSNVKSRGTWGEVQLGALLEELLTQEQFARNVKPKPGSSESVEFAIKMPGADDGPVWLPIDAKFPLEDYQRMVDAQEAADQAGVNEAGKALEARIKQEGRKIRDKYISPPHTTDFGILFLPTEGLYAEVIRRAGLVDLLRREHKVAVTGPTTLTAFLNSLQMGFQTLAIQKRSGEVWKLLGSVRTEFERFGTRLEEAKSKIKSAGDSIDKMGITARKIESRLKNVGRLPAPDEDGGAENEDG